MAAPAAKVAERLVCRNFGITKDGADVTEATLAQFMEKFKEQLPSEIITAMRDFFKLDDSATKEAEDALLAHGGVGAMDLGVDQDEAGS